jgi:hypothetical protein
MRRTRLSWRNFTSRLAGCTLTSTRAGIEFEEQTTDRITPLHQRGVVTLEQGIVQSAVLHRPAVHKQMLILPVSPRHARSADETPNAQIPRPPRRFGVGVLVRIVQRASGPVIDRHQWQAFAQAAYATLAQRLERRLTGGHRRQLPDDPLILLEGEPTCGWASAATVT